MHIGLNSAWIHTTGNIPSIHSLTHQSHFVEVVFTGLDLQPCYAQRLSLEHLASVLLSHFHHTTDHYSLQPASCNTNEIILVQRGLLFDTILKKNTWVATEAIFALPSTATTLDAPALAAKRLL